MRCESISGDNRVPQHDGVEHQAERGELVFSLMRCQGTTSPEWDVWLTWSQTVKIPCDMTRGSSGGGWLYGYDGNWGWLNGVNSRIDQIV